MPLFGKSKSKDDYDDDESKKRKVKVRIKKKKKSGDSYDGDESMYDDPMKKSSKVKKLKNRIKKKGKGDDDTYTSKESKRSKKTPTKKRTPSYDDDGEFQLDNAPPRGMMSRKAKAQPAANDDKKFRIKPYHAFPAPFYLNEAELYDCMMAPSDTVEFLTSYLTPSTKTTRRAKVPPVIMRNFGSPREDGRIGSLKVEVLGCVGLARAKPEISVYLVVGDCAFTTDIIQGARSPMWPNSSKRAAVFPLHHAYARLFVGVFDVRQRKSSEADTFCGRIAVDIPPLRPDTEYDVTFPLRHSSFIYDRTPRGVVRLRFSLHWFSERAVLMSYLKRPKNPLAFSKQAKKQPTIPCGDPKTFRNVAVTVHGVDFPGKYTRPSFRATMREFNLYQQNIRFLFKVTILDCILYENPIMSLYLFLASMHCVWLNSVRYVPPYFIGWLIYMMFESYMAYVVSPVGNLGYKPLTITEIAKGAIRDGRDKKFNFQPITVQKRARKQGKESKEPDIELQNHREFPFSERFEYLKWTAAEGIAPSPAAKNKKGGGKGGADLRTTRRLSIYVQPVGDKKDDSSESESDSEAESDEEEQHEEGADGDDGYGDMDSDEDNDEDEEEERGPKTRIFESGKASATRRIRVGPPQLSTKSGRKVPPQVHLSRVEHMLHKASKNISVEHVFFPPPHIEAILGKDANTKAPPSDVISAKEKQNFDDFDKLLGFRVRSPNPILRITSSFLGPLMRIIRIVIYATRISFNLTTWTDPFLTFWLFSFLCTLCFVLFIFPWRTFFFLSCLVLLGPQNIAVRRYLEKRSKEKEMEEKEKKEREKMETGDAIHPAYAGVQAISNAPTARGGKAVEEAPAKSKKKSRWGRKAKEDEEEEVNEADLYHSPRPAFFAHTRPTRRTQIPRDVAVPYFRFRKDRFYDWPPDPTVSRATPLLVSANKQKKEEHEEEETEYDSEEDEPVNNRVRRRRMANDAPPSAEDFGYR